MIYFREKDFILKQKIVSTNDEALIEFVKKNDCNKFDNLEFLYTEYMFPGRLRRGWHDDGLYYQDANYCGSYPLTVNRFRQKKFITLKIVLEALKNNNVEIGKHYTTIVPSNAIFLSDFFKNVDKDLSIIASIVDNPYFYEFLKKMYSDYSGFIEILHYIDFKTVDYYTTIEFLCNSREFEKNMYGGETAINNKKILTKTREFMTKLDK